MEIASGKWITMELNLRRSLASINLFFVTGAACLLSPFFLHAQVNYWNGGTGNLATAGNWTPGNVPTDIAQFDNLGNTLVGQLPTLSVVISLNEFLFLPRTNGAGFTDTATPFQYIFTISGTINFDRTLPVGINNQTGVQQIFNLSSATGTANLNFSGNSSADAANSGNVLFSLTGGVINFTDTSNAGSSIINIINNANVSAVQFLNFSSAQNAQFNISSTTSNNSVFFGNNATADNATFIFSGNATNFIEFEDSSSAANAFIDFGATPGSLVEFFQTSNNIFNGVMVGAGTVEIGRPNVTTTFTGENTYTGGTTIGAGTLALVGSGSLSDIGSVNLSGNIGTAVLDISQKYNNLTIGILSGAANTSIFLGENGLITNSSAINNRYDGIISGMGSFTIEGGQSFTLTNNNTYTGGTIINPNSMLRLQTAQVLAPTGSVTLNGGTLDLSASGNLTISDLNGDANSSVNLSINPGTNFTLNPIHDDVFDGRIGAGIGGSEVIKNNSTILTLGGNNDYFVSTVINGGTIRAGSTTGLSNSSDFTVNSGAMLDLNNFKNTIHSLSGAGTVNLGSATLTLHAFPSVVTIFSGAILGTGGLTLSGAYVLTLSGSGLNTYTGPTQISGSIGVSTLFAGAPNSFSPFSDVTLDVGLLSLQGFDNTIGSLASFPGSPTNQVSLGSGTLSLGGTNLSTTYSGTISGTGGIIKNGEGIFTLGTSNGATYSGPTIVNEGTLQAGNTNAFSSTSPVTLNHDALLDLNNHDNSIPLLFGSGGTSVNLGLNTLTLTDTTGAFSEFDGAITGSMGTLTKNSTGVFVLGGSGLNTYAADNITAGTLQAGAENVFSPFSLVTLSNTGTTLDLNGFDNTVFQIQDTVGGTQISLGAGTLTLVNSQSSTYAGNITSLVGSNYASGGLTLIDGALLTLSGINTYAGPTTLVFGEIRAGSTTALSPLSDFILESSNAVFLNGFDNTMGSLASPSSSIVDLGMATLTVGSNNIDTIFGGAIISTGGGGNLDKVGCGTLTLCGDNIYEGLTTIDGGKIDLIGSLFPPSSLQLNNNGIFDISGTLTGQTLADINGDVNTEINLGDKALTATITTNDTFNGVIEGQGGIFNLNSSPLGNTFILGGANTYTGGTNINSGILELDGSLASTGPVSVGANGTFDISNIANSQTIGDLTGSGIVLLGNKELVVTTTLNDTFSGAIQGFGANFTKAGDTSLTFSGQVFIDGNINIREGSLIFSATSTLLDPTNFNMESDTTLDFSQKSVVQIGSLNGGDETTLLKMPAVPAAQLIIGLGSGNPFLFGGILSGPSTLLTGKSTFVTLTGDNTYTGGTVLGFFSTLTIKDEGRLNPAGDLLMALASTFDISGINADSFTIANLANEAPLDAKQTIKLGEKELIFGTAKNTTFSGTITGSGAVPGMGGSITKVGSGTFTLTEPQKYTGGTTIAQGGIDLTGSASLQPTGTVTMFPKTSFDISGIPALTIGDFNVAPGASVNLGAAALTFGTANDTTIAGIISGANGQLIKNGSGKVVLSGANTYSGGTFINQGTLEGDTTSLLHAITDNATLIFDQVTNGVFAGTLLGNGDVFKIGTGQLSINTPSPAFTGTTHVENGNLALNAVLGGSLVVGEEGSVSGMATIGNNLTMDEGGAISPGNSIGVVQVNGNYLQNPGATYFLDINGAGGSDLININGTGTLFNGKVFVTSLDGALVLNAPYVILNANGGRIGLFGEDVGIKNLVFNPLLVRPVFLYTPNQVLFKFQTTLLNVAQTSNEAVIAAELDSILFPNPQLKQILNTLVNLSPEEINRALDSLSGEQYTSYLLQAEFVNRQFIRRLYDPLRPIVTFIHCPDCCRENVGFENEFAIWADGSASRTYIDSSEAAKGFRWTGFEISMGMHKTFDRVWTAGLGWSYENDHSKYSLGGISKTHNFFGGLYALYRPEDFYFLGDLTYGYSSSKMKRSIHIGPTLAFHTRSDPKINQGTLYLECGRDLDLCWLLAQPFIGIEANHYWFKHLSEHGAESIDLELHNEQRANASSRLGLHLTSITDGYSLSLDAAWQCRLTSADNNLREKFKGFGTNFSIHGVKKQRNSFDGAVTFSMDIGDIFWVFAEFSGEVCSNVKTYNGVVGLEASW